MGKLEEYIDAIKKSLAERNIEEKIDIIRFVYIAFGQYIKFNPLFSYGNQEQMKQIYKQDQNIEEMCEKSIKTHIATCKAAALSLEKMLKEFGVDIRTECEEGTYSDVHYYNVVRIKLSEIEDSIINKDVLQSIHGLDDKKINSESNLDLEGNEYIEFALDLQKDLEFIQTSSKTRYFAIDSKTGNPVIKEDALKTMDISSGYIKQHYLDDMIGILRIALSSLTRNRKSKLEEDKEALVIKSRLILDGLQLFVKKRQEGVESTKRLVDYYTDDEVQNDGMGFVERVLYHKRMFKELFSDYEQSKVHNVPCSILKNGERKYLVCVAVDVTGDDERLFMYSPEKGIYEQITLPEFDERRQSGLKVEKHETPAMKKSFSKMKKRMDR